MGYLPRKKHQIDRSNKLRSFHANKLRSFQVLFKNMQEKHCLGFAVTGNKRLSYQVYGTRHAGNSNNSDQKTCRLHGSFVMIGHGGTELADHYLTIIE
jgi:hypothetical protein